MVQACMIRGVRKECKGVVSSRRVLITAGPTIEPLDPVRFISNYSTGAIGYIIAEEVLKHGLEVCLVSGPVHLAPPPGIEIVNVKTACEMRNEVVKRVGGYDCLIMAAAVCDFKAKSEKRQKIKKTNELTVKLVKNPDILSQICRKKDFVKVGFALETEKPLENGIGKLKAKELDIVVINQVSKNSDPFGPDAMTQYTIVDKEHNVERYKKLTKKIFAKILVEKIIKLLK